jgi:hypothetical protein
MSIFWTWLFVWSPVSGSCCEKFFISHWQWLMHTAQNQFFSRLWRILSRIAQTLVFVVAAVYKCTMFSLTAQKNRPRILHCILLLCVVSLASMHLNAEYFSKFGGIIKMFRTQIKGLCTVLKTRQISEKITEEVHWRENFPVIRGNDDYFPIITRTFSLQASSPLPTKIFQIFGTG